MTVLDSDVKAIIQTARDTTPFIADASLLVSEIVIGGHLTNVQTTSYPALGSSVSSARQDLITKYLAAHFVCIMEEYGGLMASKMGGFQGAEDQYSKVPDSLITFASTRYGRTALAMDPTGRLARASANNGLKASFKLVATPEGASWWGLGTEWPPNWLSP